MASQFGEGLLVGAAGVVAQTLPDFAALSAATGRVSAVVGGVQIGLEGAMDGEVGIAADGAGEVGVVFAGEGEVADDRGAVLRFGERLEHREVDGVLGGLAADGIEQLLQFLARGVERDVVAGHAGEFSQVAHLGVGRVGVDAAKQRHLQTVEQAGDRFVGLDHEHFDEGMGEGVVFGHGIDDAALGVEDQFDIGQVEGDHALLETAGADDAGQLVHQAQGLDHVAAVVGFGLRVLAGFAQVAVDQGLSFAVGQAFGGFDGGAGDACGDDVSAGVEADDGGLAEADDAFLQGADAVAQQFGQHGDDVAWQVDAGAALPGFLVKRAVGSDEVCDVGDVDTQFPDGMVAFGGGVEPANVNRVVVVAGVGRVDGHDQLAGEVLAVVGDGAAVERGSGGLGVIGDGLFEGFRQAEGAHYGPGFDVDLAALAQHVDDDAFGQFTLFGEADQLDDDLVAEIGIAGVGVADDDRVVEAFAVDDDAPLLAFAGEFADVGVLRAFEDFDDASDVG